jgi:hypothetical protein
MPSRKIFSIVVAAAMLLPFGYTSIVSAQDLDRDRDQLKTQQQLKAQDKLQTKDQLKEQERTRERAREHMQTERPEKPQHERLERGRGGGGRH